MTYFNTWRDAILFSIASLDRQGRRSYADSPYGDDSDVVSMCAYRGRDGDKCAVGMLIPDALYHIEMEGVSVEPLIERDFFIDIVEEPATASVSNALKDLQIIHDTKWIDSDESFSACVKRVCKDRYLESDLNYILGGYANLAWELDLPEDITPPWSAR